MKTTIMWPPELVITESMFRHFTGIAEIAGYLANNSLLVRSNQVEVEVLDCAVSQVTALNLAKAAYESEVIALYINMNNIKEAIETLRFLKGVKNELITVVYGEAAACNPVLFSKISDIDYVISNGQIEYAIEYILSRMLNKDITEYSEVSEKDIHFSEGVIRVDKILPAYKWGLPDFQRIPLNEYLKLSKGEIHLLVNKGCPFHCEFCNERIVSSNRLYYRDQDQVVDFICDNYQSEIKSVYLDASTFTYDRDWILEMCRKIQLRKTHLKWKTCTRLDCIDEELVREMSKSGCTRISIGVETFNTDIQDRNKKPIDMEKLKSFSEWCHKYNVLPRALLIMGLEEQKREDIEEANRICSELKIDARFRVLQDYNALIKCDSIEDLDLTKLDRWNTWNPFLDMSVQELRQIEYPVLKSHSNNYV